MANPLSGESLLVVVKPHTTHQAMNLEIFIQLFLLWYLVQGIFSNLKSEQYKKNIEQRNLKRKADVLHFLDPKCFMMVVVFQIS